MQSISHCPVRCVVSSFHAMHDGVRGLAAFPATSSCLPPCPPASPHRLFRRLALGQRTRLQPQLPRGLHDRRQAVGAADDAAAVTSAAEAAAEADVAAAAAAGGTPTLGTSGGAGTVAAGIGSLDASILVAARMVEGMLRLSTLDFSDVGDTFALTAFLHAAQRHLQARQHMTAVVGYGSAAVLRSVDPALLTACLPHLQRFEGDLPYACGALILRALARACPLQQLSCSIDCCDEATAAAIGACTTLRGLKLELRWHYRKESEKQRIRGLSSTQRVVGGLLLPALAGLTRLTSLELDSEGFDPYKAFYDGDERRPHLWLAWPALEPLAALTALQRLQQSFWDGLADAKCLNGHLLQLPAGSLSAVTQLRLQGTNGKDMACVDDVGFAALTWAAPALLELYVDKVVGLDDVVPGSAPPWTMPHLTTLRCTSSVGQRGCDNPQSVYVVPCAAALLARAPQLFGLYAAFDFSTAVPLETHVRAFACIAAAGGSALHRLYVRDLLDLSPAAELQAAVAVAAPDGIALELPMLRVSLPSAARHGDHQMVAWLCSVVAWVDLVEVQDPHSAMSRGIFELPAAAFRLRVYHWDGGKSLLEAVRFAVEAARPGQEVCVWVAEHGLRGADGEDAKDAVAEAEAIADSALDKDIWVQNGGHFVE